ncbi:MAG: ABC transporter substrate-binding protein [Nitrospinota bacterium]
MIRILFLSAIISLSVLRPAAAEDTDEIKNLLKGKIDIVVQLLQEENMDKKKRNEKILETVSPIFDFPRMAKLSLGKKHWTGISAEERKEFSTLFVEQLKESYLDKLELYSNEDVVVEEAKRVKSRIHIVTHLVSKGDTKEMVYKFYKSKQGWKIYDVVMLGVSIVQTYRSQFDGVLKKETFEDLLRKLRKTGEFSSPTVTTTGN